jgi:hypothetical protein
MTCRDCGHAISVNKICERSIQAATEMLKHMAAHNASRDFAVAAGIVEPKAETFLSSGELSSTLSASQPSDSVLQRAAR